MSRPTKLTKDSQARIVAAIKLGLTYELAASYAGIDVRTFYAWMRRGNEEEEGGIYSQFYHAVKQSEGHSAASCMARILKAADNGQWQAAGWIMERRFGYSARQEVKIGAADDSLEGAEDLIAKVAEVAEALKAGKAGEDGQD